MSLFEQVVKDMMGLYKDLSLDPSGTSATKKITTTENLVLYEDKEPKDWEVVDVNTRGKTAVQDITGATKLIVLEFVSAFKDFSKEAKQKEPIENLKNGGFEFPEPGEKKETEFIDNNNDEIPYDKVQNPHVKKVPEHYFKEQHPDELEKQQTENAEKMAALDAIMNGDMEPPTKNTTPAKRETPIQKMPIVIPDDVRNRQIAELTFNDIKQYVCPEASDSEAFMFLKLCQARNLNPFIGEAYLIKYGNDKAQMVVGKETFTRRAEVNPHIIGWKAGIIVRTKAGKEVLAGPIEKREGSFLLPEEELLGGWANVWRDDKTEPFVYEISLLEYIGKKRDGTITKM